MKLCLCCVLTMWCAAVAAHGAPRESLAVLAVAGDDARAAQRAAAVVRAALLADGAALLDATGTAVGLSSLGTVAGYDPASMRVRVQAADEAFALGEPERAVAILEGVAAQLATDPDGSVEKQLLLEAARVQCAVWLVGLGGTGENEGMRRALMHLRDAVRARPTLRLPTDTYAPKLRRLLEEARSVVRTAGVGGLVVESRPAGATVFLEGRALGQTPLRLTSALPRGRYRLWLEHGDMKSAARLVDVEEPPRTVDVDLAFEGSLWREGPGLRRVAGAPFSEALVGKVGALLHVDVVLVVGAVEGKGGPFVYGASFSTRERRMLRRAAVPVPRGAVQPSDVASLARQLAYGEGLPLDDSEVPARVLAAPEHPALVVAAPAPAAEANVDDTAQLLPWIAAGAVGVAVAGGVVAGGALWWFSRPREGRVDVVVLP